MQFVIRRATEADYNALLEVFAEGDAFHSDALPHIFRPAPRDDGQKEPNRPWDYIEQGINGENEALLVAESEGEIIGVMRLAAHETVPYPILVPRRYVQIHEIIVKEKYRGQGVGTALMDIAHQWAADRRIDEVELTVWEFNTNAIAFYQKLGYETMNRRMKRTDDRRRTADDGS